jgi:hypothetical protein
MNIMYNQVAVVILNWNGIRDTLDCLESLHRMKLNQFKTILIDNNSRDDLSVVKTNYPNVCLIKNSQNYGFAKGNNVGIKKAAELGCKYTWILNNDTIVEDNTLTMLVEKLDNDENMGAVTNLICYYYDRYSWFAGGSFNRGIPGNLGYFRDVNTTKLDETTEWVSGCSFLARTDILDKIGGFDEKYFCYVEDADISIRIKQLGYCLGFAKDAIVWHKVSRSTGEFSPIKLYYKHRNMIYFLRKFKKKKSYQLNWYMASIKFGISLLLKHKKAKTASYLALGLVDGARGKMGRCEKL